MSLYTYVCGVSHYHADQPVLCAEDTQGEAPLDDWVPVDQRLPEPATAVLVALVNWPMEGEEPCVEMAEYHDKTGQWYLIGDLSPLSVGHVAFWRPVPALPSSLLAPASRESDDA